MADTHGVEAMLTSKQYAACWAELEHGIQTPLRNDTVPIKYSVRSHGYIYGAGPDPNG